MPYSGIFAKKASKQPAHHSLSAVVVMVRGGVYDQIRRESVPVVFCKRSSATKRGREPASV